MSATGDTMVDIVFPVRGDSVARDHRRALAGAIEACLPWLRDDAGAGVHRLNVSAGAGPRALLSGRTCLTLRLARERIADAARLEGASLDLGDSSLQVGSPQVRELRPWGTLYAHVVDASAAADEIDFLAAVQADLQRLGVACRPICGRLQLLPGDGLRGYGLMLDGLGADDARTVLEAGVGAHRRLGCGLFVPHKSAAAVGAPP
jgi:CRISPR-associated protein Cas6